MMSKAREKLPLRIHNSKSIFLCVYSLNLYYLCSLKDLQTKFYSGPKLAMSTLTIHWKNWCWSRSSSTLATWWEEPVHWKRPWCWCHTSVCSSVLSRHNKDLEWRTLKPPRPVTALGSWTDRVIPLRSQTDHVTALRQISVTAQCYSSILFRR